MEIGGGLAWVGWLLERNTLARATLYTTLEDAGYQRDQIRGLTWQYIRHVLAHPRDQQGQPRRKGGRSWSWILSEEQRVTLAKVELENHIRRGLLRLGCPVHRLEDRVAEVLRRQAEARQAALQARQQRRKGKARQSGSGRQEGAGKLRSRKR